MLLLCWDSHCLRSGRWSVLEDRAGRVALDVQSHPGQLLPKAQHTQGYPTYKGCKDRTNGRNTSWYVSGNFQTVASIETYLTRNILIPLEIVCVLTRSPLSPWSPFDPLNENEIGSRLSQGKTCVVTVKVSMLLVLGTWGPGKPSRPGRPSRPTEPSLPFWPGNPGKPDLP